MKKYLRLPVLFLLFSISAFAQNTPIPCTADSLYQTLDFWTGRWEVYNEEGDKVGDNHIEKILDGCAVMEHWTGASGAEGKSLFYVDNDSRRWKQVWVTGSATQPWGQKEKELLYARSGEQAVFQGSYRVQGALVLDRTTLTRLENGKVRQEIEVSADGGLTWRRTFVGIYQKDE